jgi:hypothetical protein
LEGNFLLDVVVTPISYESWTLDFPNGDIVIALRDGKLQVLPVTPRQET